MQNSGWAEKIIFFSKDFKNVYDWKKKKLMGFSIYEEAIDTTVIKVGDRHGCKSSNFYMKWSKIS